MYYLLFTIYYLLFTKLLFNYEYLRCQGFITYTKYDNLSWHKKE